MSYSRAHYRRVSPPADTPADLADRRRRLSALETARAETTARFPVITAENIDEVLRFQELRYTELYKGKE